MQPRSGDVINEIFGFSFILRVYILRNPGYENGTHIGQEIESCYPIFRWNRLYVADGINGSDNHWYKWTITRSTTQNAFSYNANAGDNVNVTKYTLNFDLIKNSTALDIIGVDEIIGNPAPDAFNPPCNINGFVLCVSNSPLSKIETDYPDLSLQIWFPSGLAGNSYINGNVIKYRTRWYDGSRYTYGGQTSGYSYSDWKELIPIT